MKRIVLIFVMLAIFGMGFPIQQASAHSGLLAAGKFSTESHAGHDHAHDHAHDDATNMIADGDRGPTERMCCDMQSAHCGVITFVVLEKATVIPAVRCLSVMSMPDDSNLGINAEREIPPPRS